MYLRNKCLWLWILCCLLAGPLGAVGQSDIDPIKKFAWGENIGWTNWRDANDTLDGVTVSGTFLAGFVWAENVGWINLGDGAPADGVYYANTDATDFGVSIDENDDLFGLAWGEGIGWVNFDTRDKGDERARIDCDEMRLWGYVWSENSGWINLDDGIHYVAGAFDELCDEPCGDLDLDGDVDLIDYQSFDFCMLGPNDPIPPICQDFDCDVDTDVDLQDFARFQGSFTGSLP